VVLPGKLSVRITGWVCKVTTETCGAATGCPLWEAVSSQAETINNDRKIRWLSRIICYSSKLRTIVLTDHKFYLTRSLKKVMIALKTKLTRLMDLTDAKHPLSK
jgi:hypothetical protein